jgi:hypothetical protein
MGLLLSKCCGVDSEKDIQHFRPITLASQPFIGGWDPDPLLLPPPMMSEFYTPLSERERQREDLYWYERNVIVASKMAQKMDTEIDAN